MNNDNVVSMNTADGDSTITTTGASSTMNSNALIGNTTTNYSSSFPYFSTTAVNYNLTVKKVINGYVVDYCYLTYIAKTEKELGKLILNILNPKKVGKRG